MQKTFKNMDICDNLLENISAQQNHLFIIIEDINDVALFNVPEINLNALTNNFNNWVAFDNNAHDIEDDYVIMFPQARVTCIGNNLYSITFEFYGDEEILFSVTYSLCTTSLRQIINNLLFRQIAIKCEPN